MNRYQEALNKINTEFWNYYGWEHCTEEINLLQQLVDKETPKKPKCLSICPNCENHLYINQKFCDKCGAKIDWSDE